MVLNKIFLFVTAVALINAIMFTADPGASFALSLADFNAIDLLMYQFNHFDSLHLIENLLGLVFTAALAIELEMKPEDFIFAYFVGVFIAVPLLFGFASGSIAGNSTGIFGALAATLLRARKFVPLYLSYPLFPLR